MNEEKLKYPIGKWEKPTVFSEEKKKEWITTIQDFPYKLSKEIELLTNEQLKYKYRKDGWNIKQVVCHCLDSHLNSFIRFKLALTEENPTIKPYNEAKWAVLKDTSDYPIQLVLEELKLLHKRWTFLLKSISEKEFLRIFTHPENNETINLQENLSIYAWHCNHHLAHIVNAKKFKY